MSRLRYTGNKINLIVTSAETVGNDSAELLQERLGLFGRDVALDVHYKFLDYSQCSDEGDRVRGSIAQLAQFDAWITFVIISLTEQERRGDHRQRMYVDTDASYVAATIRQLVGRVGLFLKSCEQGMLYFAPARFNDDCVVQRKRA